MIVMMAGLPGTGKSTVARGLARRLGGVVLDKDVIRAALFGPSHIEYSIGQDDFCVDLMLQTAGYLLTRQRSPRVFIDGRTFSRRYQWQAVADFAASLGVPSAILECVCSEQTALARLERDASEGTHLALNRTPDLYRSVRASFEPITAPKLLVDTDEDLDCCIERASAYLANL